MSTLTQVRAAVPMAGLRVTFPVDSRQINEDYLDAKVAGLPAASAYRWGMYLQWKRHRGERPITLAEAVAQKRAALAEAAALDRFMAGVVHLVAAPAEPGSP